MMNNNATRFYCFDQNNSGGGFDTIGENVIVEAHNADEANRIAESVGVYFDGMEDGEYVDCECCGDRWYAFDEGQTYDVFDSLESLLAQNTHHFSYSNVFATVVPLGAEPYTLAENPNAPRCTGTTKKGEQCRLGAHECEYH